jgi:hypothetical protein
LVELIALDYGSAANIYDQFYRKRSGWRKVHEFSDEIYRPYENVDSFYRYGVTLDSFAKSDREPASRQVTVPTLVAASLPDTQTHYSSSSLIASWIASSELRLDGAGDHYDLCRCKPSVLDRIRGFFGAFVSQALES